MIKIEKGKQECGLLMIAYHVLTNDNIGVNGISRVLFPNIRAVLSNLVHIKYHS